MKFFLITIVFLLIIVDSYSQEIITGEYFFNRDPGYGNGTEIIFEVGDIVDVEFIIPFTADLPMGANILFFRFKNKNNVWSHNFSRLILNEGYVEKSKIIKEVTYYFDTVSIEKKNIIELEGGFFNGSIEKVLDISHLENGIHDLYFQAVNQNDALGLMTRRTILVRPETVDNEIESLSYYFSSDDTITAPVTYEISTPALSVYEDIFLNTLDFYEDNSYTLTVHAKNKRGDKSFEVSSDFIYRLNHAPIAKFDTLNLVENSGSSLEILMDTLFSDNDIPDDKLTFLAIDDENTGILNTLSWSGNLLTISLNEKDIGKHLIQIIAQDLFGEKDSLVLKLLVDNTSNLSDIKSEKYFTFYPNPAIDYLYVHDRRGIADHILIEFLNMLGQKVKTVNKSGIIDISDLDAGVYFLIIQYSDFKQIDKLIISQ